jgi:hypothetical protein
MDGVLRSGDPTENRNQERDLTTDGYRSTRILTGENRGNREKGERRAESRKQNAELPQKNAKITKEGKIMGAKSWKRNRLVRLDEKASRTMSGRNSGSRGAFVRCCGLESPRSGSVAGSARWAEG